MNYFESKYLTLVGHVQSGKTNEEINLSQFKDEIEIILKFFE